MSNCLISPEFPFSSSDLFVARGDEGDDLLELGVGAVADKVFTQSAPGIAPVGMNLSGLGITDPLPLAAAPAAPAPERRKRKPQEDTPAVSNAKAAERKRANRDAAKASRDRKDQLISSCLMSFEAPLHGNQIDKLKRLKDQIEQFMASYKELKAENQALKHELNSADLFGSMIVK